MKHLILLFSFLGFLGLPLMADLGSPNVYAVCQVDLISGEKVAGFIVFAKGGLYPYMEVSGFFYECFRKTGEKETRIAFPVLFDLEFRGLEPAAGKRSLQMKGSSICNTATYNLSGARVNVFFLEDITFSKQGYDNKKVEETEMKRDNEIIMERTITEKHVYKLTDFIPVYTDLSGMYRMDENGGRELPAPNKILLRNVKKFTLISEPDTELLNRIEQHEKVLLKRMAELKVEGLIPVWFHDLASGKMDVGNIHPFRKWAESFN